ncbi:hypothetical protein BLS_000997 [Venturia inaequalis]|uniref:Uncharacterized protein n=1 Tax=Venturia inaequalis TaxID=5025 RepID=A0A8H3U2B4_VENIN|nr:hypothetical protein BLS_000997 [Venturia inaequalis]KAE9974181.1 hypothetical protein EG327_008836 [Venturia inaequalis]KAE9980378.1 hypothetical protein EG328_000313 [Venturia inaequalis]RDI78434.1 hypothetical protein Vi05172_g11592 [Venturia inaequalis]
MARHPPKRLRKIMHGLDMSAIIEVSDDDNDADDSHQPTLSATTRTTRQRINGEAPALYNAKYHPMDDVMRPAAAKRHHGEAFEVEEETDDPEECMTDVGSIDEEDEENSQPARRKWSTGIRHSGRLDELSRKPVDYNMNRHPQDAQLRLLEKSSSPNKRSEPASSKHTVHHPKIIEDDGESSDGEEDDDLQIPVGEAPTPNDIPLSPGEAPIPNDIPLSVGEAPIPNDIPLSIDEAPIPTKRVVYSERDSNGYCFEFELARSDDESDESSINEEEDDDMPLSVGKASIPNDMPISVGEAPIPTKRVAYSVQHSSGHGTVQWDLADGNDESSINDEEDDDMPLSVGEAPIQHSSGRRSVQFDLADSDDENCINDEEDTDKPLSVSEQHSSGDRPFQFDLADGNDESRINEKEDADKEKSPPASRMSDVEGSNDILGALYDVTDKVLTSTQQEKVTRSTPILNPLGLATTTEPDGELRFLPPGFDHYGSGASSGASVFPAPPLPPRIPNSSSFSAGQPLSSPIAEIPRGARGILSPQGAPPPRRVPGSEPIFVLLDVPFSSIGRHLDGEDYESPDEGDEWDKENENDEN